MADKSASGTGRVAAGCRPALCLVFSLFAALASSAGQPEKGVVPERPRIRIVASAFPVYDWTRQIVGSAGAAADLVLLQRSGVDLHSYRPTAADIHTIADCDLFLFIGGESDGWVERAIAQKGNPRRRVIDLVRALGDPQGKHVADEHVWLSLRHAMTLVGTIAEAMSALDPSGADAYRANAAAYRGRLSSLDKSYAEVVGKSKRRTLLVADRFPFHDLADDYGLECFAAFSGCTAESEASFRTIAFLAKKVDELQIPVIIAIEGGTHKIAETVRRATKTRDQRIMTLDSLQSTGGEDAESTRYVDVMARNLEVLRAALN